MSEDIAYEPFESVERYRAICQELRGGRPRNQESANLLVRAIERVAAFRDAVLSYCASGDFMLKPKSSMHCTDRLVLTEDLLKIVARLPLIRDGALRRVELDCVEIDPKLRLEFRNFDASVIVLRNISAGEIYIRFSKLANGVRIESSKISMGIRINGVSETGSVVVRNTEIGSIERRRHDAFQIRNSSLSRIEVEEATFEGNLHFENLNVPGDIEIRKSTIVRDIEAKGLKINGQMTFDQSIVRGFVRLDYSNLDRVLITGGKVESLSFDYARISKLIHFTKANVGGTLHMRHLRVDGAVIIENSEFAKEVELDHSIITGSVKINAAIFTHNLTAKQVQTNSFEIRDSTAKFGVLFNGIATRELFVRNVTVEDWFYVPNGKLGVLNILESKIRRFDCSDCIIEQHATVAAAYTEGLRLAGARIAGSLIFSWQNANPPIQTFRSSWHVSDRFGKPVLDLTGTKAQVVEADEEDLRVGCTKSGCGELVEARLAGFAFEQFIGGRQTILRTPDSQRRTILDTPNEELGGWIRKSASVVTSTAISGNNRNFDPQPFEMFAAALERSGRAEEATKLRIFKKDEQVKSQDQLAQWFYGPGKLLVSYGYQNEKAVWWLIALIAVGTAVPMLGTNWRTAQAHWRRDMSSPWQRIIFSLFFSIDRVVPQLSIDHTMAEYTPLQRWARIYFYFHRALGAVILAYALAGLTGVFK